MKQIKKTGILFDLDGTLWDSSQVVADSWNEALEQCEGLPYRLTVRDMQSMMGKPMDEIARLVFKNETEEKAMQLLNICCTHENEYVEEHGGILFDGVKETLQKLHKKYHISIVSNCQKGYIEAFIKYYHLEPYIDSKLDFGTTNCPKGENIVSVIQNNGLENAYYVGDTYGDYCAAQYAGIPFIYASYGFGEVKEAKQSISSFAQLLEIF